MIHVPGNVMDNVVNYINDHVRVIFSSCDTKYMKKKLQNLIGRSENISAASLKTVKIRILDKQNFPQIVRNLT